MVMLQVGGSGSSASGDLGWGPLGACGLLGSPRCGPRVPRATVRRLVDHQGMAESSRVQWRSVRLPLAGDDGETIATLALVSG